ncbi:hypothetical protein BGZ60DRAFT_423407 [Tricladium varicosporioides]|nr:hypothetical protein BGZ60DRAFT_423407 [Hymenoscyphus varicosporioides]
MGEKMADTITISQFKDALSRYPAVLKAHIKPSSKGDAPSIEELDKFRYVEAPARFSKKTGNNMTIADVQKLVDWKLHHGVWRPFLGKQVASNTDAKVEEATKDGFGHYNSHPNDIKTILEKLTKPLKGIGPATASLLLSVYDPDHVIFFSDEVYKWLVVGDGPKKNPKYTIAEFENIYKKAKTVVTRLHVTPIELEKVAFVLIKETEPVYEPKPKKEPSGLPRGRPRKPDSEKKVIKKPAVPGRGRGRPPFKNVNGTAEAKTPSGEGGHAAKVTTEDENKEDKVVDKGGDEEGDEKVEAITPTSRKRGRPAKETPSSASVKKAKK